MLAAALLTAALSTGAPAAAQTVTADPARRVSELQAAGYQAELGKDDTRVDDVGDPGLMMDVNLDKGGMATALFRDNLDVCVAVLDSFKKQIGQ